MNSKQHFITTESKQRSDRWQYLFNTRRLPVVDEKADWHLINNQPTWSYLVDLSQFSQSQLDYFAGYKSRTLGRDYTDVRIELETRMTYPISAVGCEVETIIVEDETAVSNQERPFFVGWLQGARAMINERVRLA